MKQLLKKSWPEEVDAKIQCWSNRRWSISVAILYGYLLRISFILTEVITKGNNNNNNNNNRNLMRRRHSVSMMTFIAWSIWQQEVDEKAIQSVFWSNDWISRSFLFPDNLFPSSSSKREKAALKISCFRTTFNSFTKSGFFRDHDLAASLITLLTPPLIHQVYHWTYDWTSHFDNRYSCQDALFDNINCNFRKYYFLCLLFFSRLSMILFNGDHKLG